MQKLWFVFLAFVVFCNSIYAKETPYSATSVDVITEAGAVAVDKPFSVLVKITPKNGWHIYWNNPGDAGQPTDVNVVYEFGKATLLNQSNPKYFLIQDIISQYAYDNSAYWLFEIEPDKSNHIKVGNKVTISTDVSLMACKDECVAENISVSTDILISDDTVISKLWEDELFRANKTFPSNVIDGYFQLKNDKIIVTIPNFNKNISNGLFIPEIRDLLINNQKINFLSSNNKDLYFEASINKDSVFPDEFDALLLMNQISSKVSLTQKSFETIPYNNLSFITMLFMAFLGGLILNLMPCILPVLFLKVVNLINNAYARRKVVIESMMYFCGVVFSFTLIASLLLILQHSGKVLGWGFQLQSPIFVAFLFVLFFIIGLMFLGYIQINNSLFNRLAYISTNNSKLNAFLTGLVAVLIASPCSAPFMGSAIGYSITQPWYIYFPVFLSLAIGYALPFTLIALFPKTLSKVLPKPGKWMEVLKKIFALPIFATCLWLGWIFYSQVSINDKVEASSKLEWIDFSENKVNQLITQGKPVFIDFTAKWCLTCLVNEKTALASDEFSKIVNDKNIVLIKADWTNNNDEITTALAKYGRNSVPLYVYYNNNKYVILPQILTTSVLKKFLQ